VKQTVEGFEDDDSEEDIALEAMGEADPNFLDKENDGIPLEAFNVREELDDGVIDPLSGVVNPRKGRDNDTKDEAWLVDWEEKMKDKRYASRYNYAKKAFVKQEEDDGPVEPIDKNSILNDIVNELLWGETVNNAMRRMRPKSNNPDEHKEDRLKFNSFLEKVDKAVSVGVSSIYSMTKEEILDLLEPVAEPAQESKSLWEYKWSNDDTVYGPMPSESMIEWSQQGYFVETPEFGPVMVRKVPSEEFVKIDTVDFTQ